MAEVPFRIFRWLRQARQRMQRYYLYQKRMKYGLKPAKYKVPKEQSMIKITYYYTMSYATQPHPPLLLTLLLLTLLPTLSPFQFAPPIIQPSSTTINSTSTYSFILNRRYDSSLRDTAWNTELVPAGSVFEIDFPPEFRVLTADGSLPSCSIIVINDVLITGTFTVTRTGGPGSWVLKVDGAIPSDIAIASATVNIDGILNISPALTTGGFVVKIGNDYSDNSATVTMQPAGFTSCGVTFSPTQVNTTGNMIVTLVLANAIPRNGTIDIKFPISRQWAYQMSSTHLLPIVGTLSCSLLSPSPSFLASLTCTGSLLTQTVTLQPQYLSNATQQELTATTQLSFSINGLFSPPTTEPADTLTISSFVPINSVSYGIDYCGSLVTGMTAKSLSVSYSSTSSPLFVNLRSGFMVNFTVLDSISRTDYFRLQFPQSFPILYTFKGGSLSLGTTTYSSTPNSLTFLRTTQAIDAWIGQTHNITFQSFVAPPSVRPSGSIRFVVLSARGFEKYVGVGTVVAAFRNYGSVLGVGNNVVSGVSDYVLSMTLGDELSSAGMIVLTIPSTISISACPKLTPSATLTSTPSCTITPLNSTTSSYTLTLKSLNSTTSPIASQPLTLTFSNLTNYHSAITLPAITTKIYYTEDVVDLVAVASSNTVVLVAGAARVEGVEIVGGNWTLWKGGALVVGVGLESGMPVVGGMLKLEMDSTFKLAATITTPVPCDIKLVQRTNISSIILQTTATITGTTSTTTQLSIKLPQTFSYPGSPSTLLLLTLPSSLQLRNPPTTAPIRIRISSYDNETIPNLIDDGVNFTTPIVCEPMQVSRFVVGARTSWRNLGVGGYGFVVGVVGDVLASDYVMGSVAVVGVPSEIGVGSTSRCYSNTGVDLNCTISGNTFTIPLDQIVTFRPSATSPLTLNTLQFPFTLTNLTNPLSLKPSSPFSLQLRTSSTIPYYLYAVDSTSLSVTNNETIQFGSLGYTWSRTVYGGMGTTLVGSFGVVGGVYVVVFDLGRFVITVTGVGTHAYPNCTSPTVTGITCQIIITNTSQTVRVANTINSTASPFPSTFSISLPDLLLTPASPSPSTPNPYTIPVTGLDSSNYLIYSSASTIQFQQMCAMPCQTCPSALQPNTCLSCYTNSTISPLKYLYQTTCYLSCPVHTFFDQLSFPNPNYSYPYTCTPCSLSCYSCGLVYDYCTACYGNYSLYRHGGGNASLADCVLVCPNTTYGVAVLGNGTGLECLPCGDPCLDCIGTNTSCLSCLSTYYQFRNISNTSTIVQCLPSCPTPITVPNPTTMTCSYCTPPCSLCTAAPTNCTACLSPYYQITNTLLNTVTNTSSNSSSSYGYTCLLICPVRTLPVNGTVCLQCTAPCQMCNNSLTECLSCVAGYYLSSTTLHLCVMVCQQYSFPNATARVCQLCRTISALNCYDCASATQCNRCDDPTKPGYIYFPSNRSCLATVPPGYINISGIATPCTNSCLLCQTTPQNCTACPPNLTLFTNNTSINTCLLTCPATYTSISNLCQPCLPPCLECTTSLTNCTACLSQFYSFNGVCIEFYQCPLYYFVNETARMCLACLAPCSACVNETFCLACGTGVLLEGTGECLAVCPVTHGASRTNKIINGTQINNTMICLPCLSPCATCLNLRENCTTCLPSHYFYPQISRCFLPCPPFLTVPSPISSPTQTCLQCTPPCRTCTLTQTQCLTCIQNYYLQLNSSSCVSVCAVGEYAANGTCRLCGVPCRACVGDGVCLSCGGGLLEYWVGVRVECVAVCPSHVAIVVANVCTPCQPGCLSCTSASSYQTSTCSQCSNPYALYSSHCLTTCPTPLIYYLNTSTNSYSCLTPSQYSLAQLNLTLTDTATALPLPFTVAAAFLAIATFMSRMQSRGTYIIGVLYCWMGVLEVGVLGYFLFGVYGDWGGAGRVDGFRRETWVLGVVGLGVVGVLNLLGLVIQTGYLWADVKFRAWAKHKSPNQIQQQQSNLDDNPNNPRNKKLRLKGTKINSRILSQPSISQPTPYKTQACPHKYTFLTITLLSFLTSYKLKLLLFTGLFHLTSLSFPLSSIQKFRLLNIFSFLGMLQEGLIFYMVYLVAKEGISYQGEKLLFLEIVDVVIVYAFGFVSAVLSVRKEEGFFQELLRDRDEGEVQDQRGRGEEQMRSYLKEQKEKEIRKKITSLHPDFIGMDNYHSLKNANQNGNEEQVIDVDSAREYKPTVLFQSEMKTGSGFARQQPVLARKASADQILGLKPKGSNEIDQISDFDYEGNEVNHNIMSPSRPYAVANANWVEVDPWQKEKDKEREFSGYREEQMEKTLTRGNRKVSQVRSKVGNKRSNEIQDAPVSKVSQEKPPLSKLNARRIDYDSYDPKAPSQVYTNILYKKTSQPQPEKTSKLPSQSNQLNKTVSALQIRKNEERPCNSNNKAMLLSGAELGRDRDGKGEEDGDLSYVPILPFVHQDGELKYKQGTEYKYGKDNQKLKGNIFDADQEQESPRHPDDDLEEVIQLQHKKNNSKKMPVQAVKQEDVRHENEKMRNRAENRIKTVKTVRSELTLKQQANGGSKGKTDELKVEPVVIKVQMTKQKSEASRIEKQLAQASIQNEKDPNLIPSVQILNKQPQKLKDKSQDIKQPVKQSVEQIEDSIKLEKTVEHDNIGKLYNKKQMQPIERSVNQTSQQLKEQREEQKSLSKSQQSIHLNQYQQQQQQQQQQIQSVENENQSDQPQIQPKKQIIKYYTYRKQHELDKANEGQPVSQQITKKEAELSKIRDSKRKMEKRRRSRERLRGRKQEMEIKRKVDRERVDESYKEKEKENLSVQISEGMLDHQLEAVNDQKASQRQSEEKGQIADLEEDESIEKPSFEQKEQENQKQQLAVNQSRQEKLSHQPSNRKNGVVEQAQNQQEFQQQEEQNQVKQNNQSEFKQTVDLKQAKNTIKDSRFSSEDIRDKKQPSISHKVLQLQSNIKQKQSLNQNEVTKNIQEVKNLSHGQLDNKANIIDNLSENQSHNYSHNFTNLKPFQFDQSSLKKAKFQFEQDSQQKLSNPFNGSVHTNEILNQLHEEENNSEEVDEDGERLDDGSNHADTLLRANNDQTVPLGLKRETGYNRITEENSDLEVSQGNTVRNYDFNARSRRGEREEEEDDGGLEGRESKVNKNENMNLLEVLKSAQPKFTKKKREIPIDDREAQETRLPKLNFKPPGQQQIHQNSLARKERMKYPLKQEKNEFFSRQDEYQFDDAPSQRQRQSKQAQKPVRTEQRQAQSQQQLPKPKQNQKVQPKTLKQLDSYADLAEWQQKFKYIPQPDQIAYESECMDIPAKPIIDSEYENPNGSDEMREFQYEETDKSYHKGKLFMFEESSNVFEKQSGQRNSFNPHPDLNPRSKSKSKSKSKRYCKSRENKSRQKSSMNSLQKIYLQKLDKK